MTTIATPSPSAAGRMTIRMMIKRSGRCSANGSSFAAPPIAPAMPRIMQSGIVCSTMPMR